MADDFDSYFGGTAPDGSTVAQANPDLLSYANSQLASGVSADDAIQAAVAKYPTATGIDFHLTPDGKSFVDKGQSADPFGDYFSGKRSQAQGSPFDAYFSGKAPTDSATKPSTKPASRADSTQSYIDAAKQLGAATVQAGGEYAEHATDAIANAFGQAASYIKNFGKEHETFDAGMVTPQERTAAKLMGIPDIGLTHGSVYKMTPEQRQALDDSSMRAWGLTPEQERARVEANMTGDLSSPDVVGGILSQSLMANLAEKSANPRMADTRKYYEIQDTVKALDITAHPDQHTPEEVKAAAARIQSLKDKASPSTWEQLKEMGGQAAADPGKFLKSLGYGFLIDPELALAPEARLGTLTYGAKEAAALRAAETARGLQKTARTVESAATGTSSAATAASEAAQRSGDVYGRVAARAEQAAAGAKRGRLIFDTLSAAGSGAGINAGIAASQQEAEQGYVREGSLAAPAIAGAAFGAGAHMLTGAGRALSKALPRLHPDTTTPTPATGSPDATGKVKEPGAPLPPETPVSKEGTVPYYGGVSADGKIIHLDENTPNHVPVHDREGNPVNVPAKETVAYHESIEYPLMHLEGPVAPEQLQLIKDRMGPHMYFESGVEDKLLKGESLSYAEAHDVATRSENHLVESLYNVDSKKYQEALKPYIKKVGEASKSATASDIPVDLDTKPYDNMGYPEQLHGQGARPALDKGQRGAADKRLIATGAVTGAGAAIGAAAAGPDNRTAGAVAGGLAGLGLSAAHWGEMKPTRGFGKQEAGTFAGPLSSTWKGTDEAMANRMTKVGKTDEQIHAATGMTRLPDGKWSKEFTDHRMQVAEPNADVWETAAQKPVPLSTLMSHPELEKAYPGLLNDIKVKVDPDMKGAATYDVNTGNITINDPQMLTDIAKKRPDMAPRSVLAHEVQHAIQQIEGFPRGSNVNYEKTQLKVIKSYLEDRQEALTQQYMDAMQKGDSGKLDALDQQLRKVDEKLSGLDVKAKVNYNLSAGETQARNVQQRLDLTPEERAAKSPYQTQDYPNEAQTVRPSDLPSPYADKFSRYDAQELPLIESLRDNHTKPLSEYAHKAYHETNIRNALPLLPHGNVRSVLEDTYIANHEDLATGQRGKTGVLVELDPAKLKGQINTSKPTWQHSWGQGQAEFITRHMDQQDFQGAVRSVTLKNSAWRDALPVERRQMENTFARMENAGWRRVEHDNGDVTLTRSRPPVNKQTGSIDPEMLKKLGKITGLTLLGGTLGAAANQESPGKGALYGAGLALVGGEIPFRRIFSDAKWVDVVKRREGVTANALLNAQEGAIKTGERLTFQQMGKIHELAKKGADRETITHAIQAGDVKSLDPKLQQAAKVAQDNFDSIGQQAMKEGVLHNMLDNYVTNLWKDTPARQEILDKLKGQVSTPMGTSSRFALQRYVPSIAEGKKLGLEPKTEDISEIMGIYNNSMIRAMANKQLLEGLRKMPMDTKGNMMVMPAKYAPADYVRMDHPLMEGWRVAPDIVKSLDYVYHTFSNNAALTALQGLNALAKRSVFALSMFHPMSLLQAHILANPLWKAPAGVLDFAKSLAGKSEAHKMYTNGMRGDDIDGLLKNGLMVSPPGTSLEKLNMQHDMSNQVLTNVQDFLNKALPYSGTLTAGALKKALDFNDYVVWHGTHFVLKTMTALKAYDRLKDSWAKVLEKNPDAKVPSNDELYRRAAQFSNDTFGGLNLRRVADDATTELGKSFARAITAPSPQRVAQLMLMAPDWKMSTIRTFMKSIGKSSLGTREAADLYRQYIFRGAVLYFTLFNALNNQLSGHNIWENKDPLMLDNGDGTKTQLSKHFMEFPELVHDPAKFILNSMGPVPKELFEQLTGKEFLTTSGGPPMKGSRIGHAARTFLPITASPDMTPSQRASGFVGFPQSGMTNEQKARNKEAAKQRAADKRMNKLMSGGQ